MCVLIRRYVTEAGCCWAGCRHTVHPCSQAPALLPLAQPGYLCPSLCVLSLPLSVMLTVAYILVEFKQEPHIRTLFSGPLAVLRYSLHTSAAFCAHTTVWLRKIEFLSLSFSCQDMGEKYCFISTIFKFKFFFSATFFFSFSCTGTVNQHVNICPLDSRIKLSSVVVPLTPHSLKQNYKVDKICLSGNFLFLSSAKLLLCPFKVIRGHAYKYSCLNWVMNLGFGERDTEQNSLMAK